jgi:hypothetical protein
MLCESTAWRETTTFGPAFEKQCVAALKHWSAGFQCMFNFFWSMAVFLKVPVFGKSTIEGNCGQLTFEPISCLQLAETWWNQPW